MAISELIQKSKIEEEELEPVDECPDCQTAMTLFYDEDDMAGHVCENCGYEMMPKRSCSYGDYQLGY